MTPAERVAWSCAAALAGTPAVVFLLQSCAVSPSDDCESTATCPPSPNGEGGLDAPVSSGDAADGASGCGDRAGYTCAALPNVSGWLGPVALHEGPAGAATPPCPALYTDRIDAKGALNAPEDTCFCACAATGQECTPSTTQFYTDPSCKGACDGGTSSAVVGPDACAPVNPTCHSVNFEATEPTPSSGGCSPQVSKSNAPWSFTTAARVCSWAGPADGGGCGPNEECLAAPASPYYSSLCIYSTGDSAPSACPAGSPYSVYHVYYASADDQRGCSSCTCSAAPTGGSCSGTIGIYSSSNCSGAPKATFVFGQSCLQLTAGFVANSARGSYALTPGICSVSEPPTVIGTVVPSGATAVCCVP